ncbi:MAG: phosphotransferase enzyme family protein [Humibacter sp.]
MSTAASREGPELPHPSALLDHLDRVLDAGVTSVDELDQGVFRIGRAEHPDWVMRVFPSSRPIEAVHRDATILRWLAEVDFPAERLASALPVSHVDGCPVLVTEYVDAVPRMQRRDAIRSAGGLRRLGELLGMLSALGSLPNAPTRPGGAWHHLAEGHPREELFVARTILTELAAVSSGPSLMHLDRVRKALDDADDGDGLPEGVIHPDFVLANVVATADPEMVLVDWAGAGRGPRAWPLAFLLWAETMKNPARADLVLAGYHRRVSLEDIELERLPGLVRARPLVFAAWRLSGGDIDPAHASVLADAAREQGDAIGTRARAALRHLAS